MKTERPIPAAEVIHLADLVQYAEGSIVTRAPVRKPSGSLTRFAIDAGQGLNEHTAGHDGYVTILDGVGQLVVDGKPIAVKAGETVLMPASVPTRSTRRRASRWR